MADEDQINRGNGSGAPEDEPQVATITQYIKDLSVESPSSPQAFQWQVQPQLEVQFNINVDKVADDVHEVVLKIEVAARSDQGTHFLIDLSYAGLYGLRNIPDEALPPFLLIEAPRLLFPFARQIIADASNNTGFPPVLLEPIDFGAAYMAQLQAAQQAQGQAGVGGAPGEGEAASGGASEGAAPVGPTVIGSLGNGGKAKDSEAEGDAEPTGASDETRQG